MITAVNSCGCPLKLPPKVPQDCVPPPPPCPPIPSSPRSRPGSRRPFENPRPRSAKEDEARCPCPRDGEARYESMRGQCSPCCGGVFPDKKVVSKIVQGGKPYKEIEAVINDNRMVIRIQRESLENEWEPPCDCAEGVRRLGGGGCEARGKDVVFQKTEDSCGSRVNCRTVSVFPQLEEVAGEAASGRDNSENDKKDKGEKPAVSRLVDLEENPNIFLLRIRKRSEKPDRKNYMDLEFRTPRPWGDRPKPKVVPEAQTPSKPEGPVVEKKATKGKGAAKKKKGKK